ncbi:MAG: hypothetical protein EZS28_035048 [Streblomastix strix]|uniref:Uncharacterized protein n=1 Tax=Streblomastix strix TaxID=222440 RepID=A0A5J4UIM6_9EUKA|nr:MAG: hypothetical protein EZS28_035048 [Streblomastix strix]
MTRDSQSGDSEHRLTLADSCKKNSMQHRRDRLLIFVEFPAYEQIAQTHTNSEQQDTIEERIEGRRIRR